MRWPFGVAVFAVGGLLAGCGGGARGTPRVAVGATAREIAAAASRTLVVVSGRFEVSITANGAGRDVSVRAHGVFDNRRHRYLLSSDTSRPIAGFAGALDVIATSNIVYLRAPQLARRLGAGTDWISTRHPGGDLLRLQLIDPAGLLDLLQSDGATIRGAPVEVLLDDDGFVRRITMRFDAPGSEGSALVSVQYSDFGAPVTIEPPSADEVTDETGVLEPLLGANTGG